MPATNDGQGSFLNRISIRRNQVVAMENHDQELEDLELFQKHVADRLSHILSTPSAAASTIQSSSAATDSPSALIPDLLDRSVKALDNCNAITHGVELVRLWQKLAQIAVSALQQNHIGEGQARRAEKVLTTLLTSMVLDDKEIANTNNHGKSTERAWSFGRRSGSGNCNNDRTTGNFLSLSWSAAKQIQAMSSNLAAPSGRESTGLAMPVYIMSTVLVFVTWGGYPLRCSKAIGLGPAHPMIGKIGE